MIKKAIVLTGGSGERIKAITGGKPKVLLKLLGRTVVERVLDNLVSVGINEIIVISDRPLALNEVIHPYKKYANIYVVEQKKPELLGAIKTAIDYINEDVLLVYGDILTPKEAILDVLNANELYRKRVMMIVPEEDIREYGAVKISENGKVIEFIEKPKANIEGTYAFGGVMTLDENFSYTLKNSSSLEDTIKKELDRDGFIASIWSGWWVDIGYPWDLLKALFYLLNSLGRSEISAKAEIEDTVLIDGPVIIEDGAKIDHYAIIKGPVYIGENVYVGNHSLIRPYTSLEKDTVIHAYSEVFWTSVQEGGIIGRSSFVGFSVLGERAIIEPNVITKVLLNREELKDVTLRPIEIIKGREKKYYKLGAFISAKKRINAGSILQPGKIY